MALTVATVATILVATGGDSPPDHSSLADAVAAGDVEAARALLRAGADPDTPRVHGFTPLQRAVLRDDLTMVGVLLAAGADPEAPALEGLTAAHVAAEAGSAGALRLVVEAGADLDARSGNGMNAIDHAAAGGSAAAIEVLATAGAAINAPSQAVTQGHGYPADTGSTPLGIAARAGHTDAVAALLAAGAAVDAPSTSGHTPLLLAVFAGAPADLVGLLLDAGADPTAVATCTERCAYGGGDALDWARHLDRTELIPLLEG